VLRPSTHRKRDKPKGTTKNRESTTDCLRPAASQSKAKITGYSFMAAASAIAAPRPRVSGAVALDAKQDQERNDYLWLIFV
jgi:hypothetical protein